VIFKVCFLFLLMGSQFALASKPVRVGVALRASPELNSFALDLNRGIEFAKERFESLNPGSSFELIRYPDQAAKHVLEDGVKFVIGGEMSDEAFALADQFHDKKVLLLTPTASNPLLTSGNPFVFRFCYSDDQVARQMAEYAASLPSVQSVGVLHNTVNSYSDYLTTRFLERYEELQAKKKGPEVTVFRFASESPDFRNAVQKFKTAGVDLVVAFTLQESLRAFSKLASGAKFHPNYLGTDGWGTDQSVVQLLSNQGIREFKGVRNSYWHPESQNPSTQRFRKAFLKKYGAEPNAWNAVAYDSAYVLFSAIEKTKGKPEPESVAAILKSEIFQDSVTSKSIRFNSKNGVIRPLYLYQISPSGARFLKSVE